MRVLEEEGLVQRKQGLGTFICQQQRLIKSSLDVNEGVTEMIEGRGMVPGSQNTQVYEIEADKKLAEKLELTPGSPLVCIERVRTADGQCVAYTPTTCPNHFFRVDDVPGIVSGSLYTYIEEHMGLQLADSLLTISPVKANKKLAKYWR